MKHKFYNDGNTKPVCWRCSGEVCTQHFPFEEGLLYTLLPLTRKVIVTLLLQQPTAHLTPVPFIQNTP
jgi:hypothetical protein